MRLSGIEGFNVSAQAGRDISLMTEGELFTQLIQRQLEIKMKHAPTAERRALLEQVQDLNRNGVHGIGNIRSFDKKVQEIIAYAQHNPQAALGGGIGAIDQQAIKRACENKTPAPDSAVPWATRQQYKLQCGTSKLCYNNKVTNYHNTNLGRQGWVNACFNSDMKSLIINEYFEDGGPALMYKAVNDESILSDRALTKKQFQGLYGNSLKHVTGISETNLNQFIQNGINDKFYGRDAADVIEIMKNGSKAIGFDPITILTIIAIIATAAGSIAAAIEDGKKTDDWSTMSHNLPVLTEVTPSDSDFITTGTGNGNNGTGEGLPNWALPAGIAAGGLGMAYAFGLFD